MSPHGKFYVQYSPLTAWSQSGLGSRFWAFPHDKLRVLLYCWVLPWTVGINCCRGTPAFTPGCWKTTPGWPTSRRGLLDCSRIIFKKGVVSCKNKTTEIVGKNKCKCFYSLWKGKPSYAIRDKTDTVPLKIWKYKEKHHTKVKGQATHDWQRLTSSFSKHSQVTWEVSMTRTIDREHQWQARDRFTNG